MKKILRLITNILAIAAFAMIAYAAYAFLLKTFRSELQNIDKPQTALVVQYLTPAPIMRSEEVTSEEVKVIASEAVNIRKGPSEHTDDIGDLSYGALVKVYECQDGWARIDLDQWVKAKYLQNACGNEYLWNSE